MFASSRLSLDVDREVVFDQPFWKTRRRGVRVHGISAFNRKQFMFGVPFGTPVSRLGMDNVRGVGYAVAVGGIVDGGSRLAISIPRYHSRWNDRLQLFMCKGKDRGAYRISVYADLGPPPLPIP